MVLYYSATGNTEFIAQELSKGREKNEATTPTSIAH